MTNDKPGPYDRKPGKSEASEWHELGFQISVDVPVDWSKFDLRSWSHVVARYTAKLMAATTMEDDDENFPEVVKTLLMNIGVEKVSFVTDDKLHGLIDEFEE